MARRLLVRVRVQAGASKSEIVGIVDGRLRIRSSAPPADGRANNDLIRQLADAFGVPRSRVSLKSGTKGRLKTFVITDPEAEPDWLQDSAFK